MRRASEQNDACNLYCLPSAASLRFHQALIFQSMPQHSAIKWPLGSATRGRRPFINVPNPSRHGSF
jgi:hypothetical protein